MSTTTSVHQVQIKGQNVKQPVLVAVGVRGVSKKPILYCKKQMSSAEETEKKTCIHKQIKLGIFINMHRHFVNTTKSVHQVKIKEQNFSQQPVLPAFGL